MCNAPVPFGVKQLMMLPPPCFPVVMKSQDSYAQPVFSKLDKLNYCSTRIVIRLNFLRFCLFLCTGVLHEVVQWF